MASWLLQPERIQSGCHSQAVGCCTFVSVPVRRPGARRAYVNGWVRRRAWQVPDVFRKEALLKHGDDSVQPAELEPDLLCLGFLSRGETPGGSHRGLGPGLRGGLPVQVAPRLNDNLRKESSVGRIIASASLCRQLISHFPSLSRTSQGQRRAIRPPWPVPESSRFTLYLSVKVIPGSQDIWKPSRRKLAALS